MNVTHGVSFENKQKPTRPVESLPVSPRRRRCCLCRNPTLPSTNKDEFAVECFVLRIKKNIVSVREKKKYFIKLVKIKNTEDEQLSCANNRLGTTSPARDLSFYAKTFVVGGWLSRNALWVMTFLTPSTYVRPIDLKKENRSLFTALLLCFVLIFLKNIRKGKKTMN